MIATLSNKIIGKHLERITEFKLLINQCERNDINFPAEAKDWRKFETNNKTIPFNFFLSSLSNREKNKQLFMSK